MQRLPSEPWLYRKMVHPPEPAVQNGALVEVRNRDGTLLGRGLLNRKSEIAIRMLAGPAEPGTFDDILARRLRQARRLREDVLRLRSRTEAYRLVHGEADGLPGLAVDIYGHVAVAMVYSLGYIHHGPSVESALGRLPGIERVLFRADPRVAAKEGFSLPDPPAGQKVIIREDQVRYEVDLAEGHKTGLFLDQRENRRLVAGLAEGQRILDVCTNAGGFALSCAATGRPKSVTGVDLDEKALARARRNGEINKLKVEWVHADLFPYLRERTAAGERWPRIVLDPPRLTKGRKDLGKALNQYFDMNQLAISALAPSGLILTCSCSSAVTETAFLEVLKNAASAAGRQVRILGLYGASPDHPVAMNHPEGRYLKAALLQATESYGG